MAKWKNALLISTIVAPIAFGAGPLGDVLAAPINENGTPTKFTDVTVHKYLNTTGDTSTKDNYYWGNGEDIDADPTKAPNGKTAFSQSGWQKAKAGYTFTAYALPGNVIDGYSQAANEKDKPVISDEYVVSDAVIADYLKLPAGSSVTVENREAAAADTNFEFYKLADKEWSDILTAEKGTGASYEDGATSAYKSEYTFVLTTDPESVAELEAYLEDNNSGSKTATTGPNGDATLQDLDNGEWIVFETSNPAGDASLTEAVPMVLDLSMVRADASGWFGTATANPDATENALNLYPKDYLIWGSLKVVKSDIDETKLNGIQFLLLQDSSATAAGIAQLRADIASNKTFIATYGEDKSLTSVLPGTGDGAKTIVELNTAEVQKLLATYSAYSTISVSSDSPQTTSGIDTTTGKALGEATFSVKPNQTYYIMETSVGSNDVDEIDVIQEVQTTADAEDGTNVEEDGVVYFDKGVSNITNLPIPDVNKKIAVEQGTDASKQWIYDDNDFSIGVSRGEEFKYSVSADYNNALDNDVHAAYMDGTTKVPAEKNGYNVFKITDTFDHEIDITHFRIGTTDTAGVFTAMYDVDLTVNGEKQAEDGGFSGNGGAYAFAVYAPGVPHTEENDQYKNGSGPLAAYLKLSGNAAEYKADGTTVPDGGTTKSGEITVELVPNAGGVHGDTTNDPGDFSTNDVATALVTALGSAKTGQMTLVMDAQTNSSATVGEINNKAKLTSQPVYGSPTVPEDNSKTFNAGWEFVKTKGDDTALKGAGFVLSRTIESTDVQGDRFLNVASGILKTTFATDANVLKGYMSAAEHLGEGADWYLGTADGTKGSALEKAFTTTLSAYNKLEKDAQTTDEQVKVAQALLDVLNDSAQYATTGEPVYFAHLDQYGAPQVSMEGAKEMGDVLWTPYEQLATTHFTDGNGYFQYCGLATGPYTLTETVVPSGYDGVDPIKFYLMNPAYDYIKGLGAIGDDAIIAALQTKYELNKTDATKLLADYNADMQDYEDNYSTYELLNGKVSDDQITGTDDTADLVDLAKEGKVQQIKNYEKSIFPLVGGIGTLFAVIAGLLAMGLALLKRKKDMNNEA